MLKRVILEFFNIIKLKKLQSLPNNDCIHDLAKRPDQPFCELVLKIILSQNLE